MLAAAHETDLLPTLEAALPTKAGAATAPRLARATTRTRRHALLTLLFLGVVGLHRPWDLRGYVQEGLALLTTRRRAYGYRTVERFLSQIAQAGGAEAFTDALARWTTRLWTPEAEESQPTVPTYYVDGHRKPVFSDRLLPRGVIGRTSKILGCRTLLLLHDAQGHPLLATTHRGDLHLTLGTPSLLTRYETATNDVALQRLVIDREGMGASSTFTIQLPEATVGLSVGSNPVPTEGSWLRAKPREEAPGGEKAARIRWASAESSLRFWPAAKDGNRVTKESAV